MLRMVDMLKSRGITAVFTSLREDGSLDHDSNIGVSSLMDAWIKLLNIEANGERSRTLYVIKARGMRHSNQVREFSMSGDGIALVEAYIGPAGVLTGTARVVQEAEEAAAVLRREQESRRRRREAERRRQSLERQIDELRATLEAAAEEEAVLLSEDEMREAMLTSERRILSTRRGGTR
jgi:circadian clock protein KaiC